ncbi:MULTISPECIES: Gfo/Idh/MocA family protein [unclassified Rhizobium]|uniref:Gfo/Idh/MocA family protein n=1 Tax=unclassified Rhizobium TaxID=2613769 RepID=UPI001ADAB2BE|nr:MULTISPECIES: Gfo/Idh/MocA family oxidoreductase [unclassified Rhizobium]MBO9123709.1 Gfo/Idh/MocA family oxidoreductase [Rhizobium sp. 16-488-2b]MBO9174241.1 Gfo/Idh/MocA family oxidoreductase [Rhizobium sp. 16-488-2a]
MEKTLGWGILATGWIAELFTQDLILSGRKVVAVGSRSKEKATDFAQRFGIANAHGSYQDLVANPEVDIIYVATPHPHHAEAALMALDAGKHVLVEKPFTLNAAEARRIVERAREKNLVVLEAMWTRFLPHMRRIHEIIEAGTLGELRAVSAEHRQFLPSDPGHRLNAPELGGGALLDLGIYPISFAIDVLGPPVSIDTAARFQATGVDAEIETLMKHAGGAISTTASALDSAGPNAATVYGSKARIEIAPVWYTPTSFKVVDQQGTVIETFDEPVEGRGMQYQALEMERLVALGETSSLMPPQESVTIMEVLDSIRAEIGLLYPGEQPAGSDARLTSAKPGV